MGSPFSSTNGIISSNSDKLYRMAKRPQDRGMKWESSLSNELIPAPAFFHKVPFATHFRAADLNSDIQ